MESAHQILTDCASEDTKTARLNMLLIVYTASYRVNIWSCAVSGRLASRHVTHGARTPHYITTTSSSFCIHPYLFDKARIRKVIRIGRLQRRVQSLHRVAPTLRLAGVIFIVQRVPKIFHERAAVACVHVRIGGQRTSDGPSYCCTQLLVSRRNFYFVSRLGKQFRIAFRYTVPPRVNIETPQERKHEKLVVLVAGSVSRQRCRCEAECLGSGSLSVL